MRSTYILTLLGTLITVAAFGCAAPPADRSTTVTPVTPRYDGGTQPVYDAGIRDTGTYYYRDGGYYYDAGVRDTGVRRDSGSGGGGGFPFPGSDGGSGGLGGFGVCTSDSDCASGETCCNLFVLQMCLSSCPL